jgi:hypothetical protein
VVKARTKTVSRILKNRSEARSLAAEIVEDQAKVEEFQKECDELARKRGIDALRYEIPHKRQRLLDFMGKNGMSRLDLGELGYVNFIQAVSEHIWITTKADLQLAGIPENARSLRSILGRELFMRATKRVADPKAIEQLIEEGEITEDQIAPAHYTRMRAPYIRFEKGPA